jgi:hypothetical protein
MCVLSRESTATQRRGYNKTFGQHALLYRALTGASRPPLPDGEARLPRPDCVSRLSLRERRRREPRVRAGE